MTDTLWLDPDRAGRSPTEAESVCVTRNWGLGLGCGPWR